MLLEPNKEYANIMKLAINADPEIRVGAANLMKELLEKEEKRNQLKPEELSDLFFKVQLEQFVFHLPKVSENAIKVFKAVCFLLEERSIDMGLSIIKLFEPFRLENRLWSNPDNYSRAFKELVNDGVLINQANEFVSKCLDKLINDYLSKSNTDFNQKSMLAAVEGMEAITTNFGQVIAESEECKKFINATSQRDTQSILIKHKNGIIKKKALSQAKSLSSIWNNIDYNNFVKQFVENLKNEDYMKDKFWYAQCYEQQLEDHAAKQDNNAVSQDLKIIYQESKKAQDLNPEDDNIKIDDLSDYLNNLLSIIKNITANPYQKGIVTKAKAADEEWRETYTKIVQNGLRFNPNNRYYLEVSEDSQENDGSMDDSDYGSDDSQSQGEIEDRSYQVRNQVMSLLSVNISNMGSNTKNTVIYSLDTISALILVDDKQIKENLSILLRNIIEVIDQFNPEIESDDAQATISSKLFTWYNTHEKNMISANTQSPQNKILVNQPKFAATIWSNLKTILQECQNSRNENYDVNMCLETMTLALNHLPRNSNLTSDKEFNNISLKFLRSHSKHTSNILVQTIRLFENDPETKAFTKENLTSTIRELSSLIGDRDIGLSKKKDYLEVFHTIIASVRDRLNESNLQALQQCFIDIFCKKGQDQDQIRALGAFRQTKKTIVDTNKTKTSLQNLSEILLSKYQILAPEYKMYVINIFLGFEVIDSYEFFNNCLDQFYGQMKDDVQSTNQDLTEKVLEFIKDKLENLNRNNKRSLNQSLIRIIKSQDLSSKLIKIIFEIVGSLTAQESSGPDNLKNLVDQFKFNDIDYRSNNLYALIIYATVKNELSGNSYAQGVQDDVVKGKSKDMNMIRDLEIISYIVTKKKCYQKEHLDAQINLLEKNISKNSTTRGSAVKCQLSLAFNKGLNTKTVLARLNYEDIEFKQQLYSRILDLDFIPNLAKKQENLLTILDWQTTELNAVDTKLEKTQYKGVAKILSNIKNLSDTIKYMVQKDSEKINRCLLYGIRYYVQFTGKKVVEDSLAEYLLEFVQKQINPGVSEINQASTVEYALTAQNYQVRNRASLYEKFTNSMNGRNYFDMISKTLELKKSLIEITQISDTQKFTTDHGAPIRKQTLYLLRRLVNSSFYRTCSTKFQGFIEPLKAQLMDPNEEIRLLAFKALRFQVKTPDNSEFIVDLFPAIWKSALESFNEQNKRKSSVQSSKGNLLNCASVFISLQEWAETKYKNSTELQDWIITKREVSNDPIWEDARKEAVFNDYIEF